MINTKHLAFELTSTKGLDREENSDITMLFRLENSVLVVMLDISTKHPIPIKDFGAALHHEMTIKLAELSDTLSPSLLLQVFNQTRQILREHFKYGSAACLIAFISISKVWGFTAGDVRLGKVTDAKNQSEIPPIYNWYTPVHSTANIFAAFEEKMKLKPDRHILTRCLRINRSFKPEYFEFDCEQNETLIVATDGFWCELTEAKYPRFFAKPEACTNDDCTALILNIGQLFSEQWISIQQKNLFITEIIEKRQ